MPRSLSDAFWEQATKRVGDDPYLAAIEIEHDVLSAPIRVVCNFADVVSNGDTYVGLFFDLKLPGESEETTRGEIVIQNVDQRIGRAAKKIKDGVRLRLLTMLVSDPDTIEQDYRHMTLMNVKVTDWAVSAEIWGHDLAGRTYPNRRATPARCPGVWV